MVLAKECRSCTLQLQYLCMWQAVKMLWFIPSTCKMQKRKIFATVPFMLMARRYIIMVASPQRK